jgi:hypothetical protein
MEGIVWREKNWNMRYLFMLTADSLKRQKVGRRWTQMYGIQTTLTLCDGGRSVDNKVLFW